MTKKQLIAENEKLHAQLAKLEEDLEDKTLTDEELAEKEKLEKENEELKELVEKANASLKQVEDGIFTPEKKPETTEEKQKRIAKIRAMIKIK